MIKGRHDVVVYLERVADRIQHNHRFSVLNMRPVFLYWRFINAYLPHTLVCSCCHVPFFLCLSSSEVSGAQEQCLLHCFDISKPFSVTFGFEVLIHVCPIFFDRFYIKSIEIQFQTVHFC